MREACIAWEASFWLQVLDMARFILLGRAILLDRVGPHGDTFGRGVVSPQGTANSGRGVEELPFLGSVDPDSPP